MIESLDVRTLVVVLILGHAVAALLLFFDTRKRAAGFDIIFMIGMAFQSIAWLLIYLRGIVPDLISFELGNSLIFAGMCLEGISLLSLNRNVDKKWLLFYISVLALLLAIWWIPTTGQNMKMGIAAFITPLFFFFPATFLVFFASRPSPLQKFIGATILLYAIATMFRGIYILIAGSYSLTLPSFYQILFLLVQIIAMILISTGYILIRKEFANADLEQDITERRRIEQVLRESENRFRQLADVTIEGIVIHKDGIIREFNDRVCEIIGYQPEELRGKDLITLIAPESVNLVRHNIAVGYEKPYDAQFLRRNQPKVWVEIRGHNFTQGGEVLRIATIWDLTERRAAEAALRESETQYREIIENIQDMVYRADMNGKFTMVSPSGARLVGLESPDQLVGRDVAERYANSDDRKAFLEALKHNGSVYGYPITLKAVDGTIRHVTSSSHFFYDAEGVVQGVEGVIHDVTDLVRAEEAIRQANKKLTLLSSITRHDINNQLMVQMGYLSMLEQKQPDLINTEYFLKVSTAAKRIAAMVQFTKEYEEIGVNAPVWQDCHELVETASKQAPLGQVIVKNDLSAGIEVFADPMVVKVFYNLMDNAVRYGGKITTIRFTSEEQNGAYLIICEDDGDGVPVDEKEKIFERGFGKNTGLGLAISREILDITGISIRETGEPGKGARFEMIVPKGAWRVTGKGN